ncbi:MAG TPA: hypothetical protein VM370_06475 [Candidatus Thermoplasmatota archaeon]|nr:hypothetical protein [Candidatus Thermoplasmatota archaeon]
MRAPLVALALFLAVAPAPSAAASVSDYTILVDGETAHGLLAVPAGAPLGLVVVSHGYGHKAESHRGHLQHLADEGYVAVAMDFRGEGMPLRAGADDTLAATHALIAQYAPDLVVLYSVSMGTAVASMVLAESGGVDCSAVDKSQHRCDGVFDYWVDNEGLVMLHETWAGASALAPTGNPTAVGAVADIEAECGGSPIVAPDCYLERSAVIRAPEFVGLKGAIQTHGLNDGLVPYDQGREMRAALAAIGVPTEFYTVATCPQGSEGTTLTGHAGQGGRGVCGHGTESNDAHTLTELSFRLLDELLGGAVPHDAEHIVDGTLGTLP